MKDKIKIPESAIQGQIITYLLLNGYKAFRINSGSIKTQTGGLVKLAPKGFSDILAVEKETGRAVFIEVKAIGNKLTFFQELFLEEMRKQGAIAFTAYNVDEVIGMLKINKKEKTDKDPHCEVEINELN